MADGEITLKAVGVGCAFCVAKVGEALRLVAGA